MTVNPSFRTFVIEQLARVLPGVRSRTMFGGVGIYSHHLFFALIDQDTVYFKVDDTNRSDFEGLGMGPFQPYGPDGEVMQYYELPQELLEDIEALRSWAERSVEVARRRKAKR